MTKKEFLNELETRILKIGKGAECNGTLEYFSEVIDDMVESGMTENEAVEKLGAIDSIIDSIRDEATDDSKTESKIGEYVTDVTATYVENIIYNDTNNGVRFEVSPDDDYHITTYETEKKGYEIKQSGNDIKIISYEKYKATKWKRFFGISYDETKTLPVIIKLPRTFSGNINTKTTNGGVTIDGVSANKINSITTNGAVALHSVAAPNMYIETINGAIVAESVAGNYVELSSSNGALRLRSIAASTVVASTSNGAVTLNSITAQSVEASTSNGGMQFDSISVSEKLSLHSSNGRISGRMPGKMSDYAITSNTSNAKNNLPNGTSGAIILEVTTSNAKIEVEFAEK